MTPSNGPRRVLAIVANVKQFRLPFYTQLAAQLEAKGVILSVAFSAPYSEEATKRDSVDLQAPLGVKCRRLYFANGRLLLQYVPFGKLREADLIIIVQSIGYLTNYPLLIASKVGLKRVAFWGHSHNHQGAGGNVREAFRRWLVRLPDWWFAYTSGTTRQLLNAGVPAGRITTINNAVDTRAFGESVASVAASEVAEVRTALRLPPDSVVGLYCGSLYGHKHIDLLLRAAARIHSEIPEFRLVIVGAGPDAAKVEGAVERMPWLRYVGPLFNRQKAAVFRLSSVFLNPGLVGLAILDSFAAGLPFITTDIPIHSPEISYLESGISGLMLPHEEIPYGDAVVALLRDAGRLESMRRGAYAASQRYTIENMVENVVDGIARCLNIAGPAIGARRIT